MHLLFLHKNYPAQFGRIANYLATRHGCRCTFVSATTAGTSGGVERIQYAVKGRATENTHYCCRTFENTIWHAHAAYQALEVRQDVRPDLVVAHSGMNSSLFLRELDAALGGKGPPRRFLHATRTERSMW